MSNMLKLFLLGIVGAVVLVFYLIYQIVCPMEEGMEEEEEEDEDYGDLLDDNQYFER